MLRTLSRRLPPPPGPGFLLAALASGTAVGTALERALVRRRLPQAGAVAFGDYRDTALLIPVGHNATIYAEVTPSSLPDDDLTVVFCHGYGLNQDSWHYQRRDLAGRARLVFYDQRSHARSSRGPDGSHSIDQLGTDLQQVIMTAAPSGSLILVGHSMGGMTIMALAEQYPDLFVERVRGVALLATSSGELSDVPLGLPGPAARLVHRSAPDLAGLLTARRALVEVARARQNDLSVLLTGLYSFGSAVPAVESSFVADMLAAVPIEVLADYLPTFLEHDKAAALAGFSQITTTVMVGECDLLTPTTHGRRLAEQVGGELTIVPNTGHMIITERAELVTSELAALIDSVREADDGA
ncbi:MAG: alpha/beta hydrolase [Actinomycetia bacterium]|nr:alpha/beta hydrolase [Actinomycetes bacterium]